MYLKPGYVGVIYEGSMHIRSHSIEILNPFTVARLDRGSVIGHYSDDGLSTDSENWIQCYQDKTACVWLLEEEFTSMWRAMGLVTDKMMLVHNASFNPMLSCLSEQTLTKLIFDHA